MSLPVLNRRLLLEAPSRQPDGAGGHVDEWRTLGTLWAEVRPRSGREVAGPGGRLSLSTVRVVVHGAPPGSDRRPAPDQRMRDASRIYHILAVTEADAAGRYLICDAREEIAS